MELEWSGADTITLLTVLDMWDESSRSRCSRDDSLGGRRRASSSSWLTDRAGTKAVCDDRASVEEEAGVEWIMEGAVSVDEDVVGAVGEGSASAAADGR